MQRIQTLCDRHMSREVPEEVDAEAGTITLAVMKRAAEIDLCFPCLTELNDLLEPYFAMGRRPGRTVYAPTPTPARQPRSVPAPDGNRVYKEGDEPNGPMIGDRPTWLCRAPGVECVRKDPNNPKGPFESLLATAIHESRTHHWRNGKPSRTKQQKAPARGKRPARELADASV